MKLDQIKQEGGFATDHLVKQSVTWKKAANDEVTFDVFIAKPSFGEMERLVAQAKTGRSQGAELISLCVRFGDSGEEKVSYEQAYDMVPSLVEALSEAVIEVTGIKKDSEKN